MYTDINFFYIQYRILFFFLIILPLTFYIIEQSLKRYILLVIQNFNFLASVFECHMLLINWIAIEIFH